MHAAMEGHEGVVKILLKREEVNPDRSDNDGWTPLAFAASRGHAGVVKVSLEQEVANPGKPDNGCETQISHAALTGQGSENTTRTGRAQSRHSR